jgi:adenosylmethionine-8-amino-7-oxononanoate aminotransferase
LERQALSSTVLDHELLVEHDKQQLHPLQHPSVHKNPLVVESGQGVWLHTTDGRKVLDGMAGLWNVNVGYGNEELPLAAYEQMKKVAFTSNFAGMTTPPAAELAHRLAGLAHPPYAQYDLLHLGWVGVQRFSLQDGALLLVSPW